MINKLVYIKTCKKCSLHTTRRKVVIGRGELPADILIIGEGPGRTEDLMGYAFIGNAGKLLDQMLIEAQIFGHYRIFFTNAVLCHPCDSFGGDNRPPNKNEVLHCMSNVNEIIMICAPRVIIIAGDVPFKYYGKLTICPVIKIQHPSFILKSGGKSSPFYIKNIRLLEGIHEILFN